MVECVRFGGACREIQNPLFRTRAVLQLHQYTQGGIRRSIAVCALTLLRRRSALVAGGVTAAEYHAAMCVIPRVCVHSQKPLFRRAYGAVTSPIHTLRHPPRCCCVCCDTTTTQKRHGSGRRRGGGVPCKYVCDVGGVHESIKPAFSTPLWCCNFTNTHHAATAAVLLCVL